MSAQPDLVSLYSAALLELASSLPETRPAQSLGAAAQRGYARSPQCGSSVELHVVLDDDRIAELSHTVRACALGQAAASAVAQAAVGADLPQITLARTQLEAMLTQDGPTPQAPFEKLELLRAAREFKNRHASILLYLKALETAMQP